MFKYLRGADFKGQNLSFTFQSGYVQMYKIDNLEWAWLTFTFQSGYVQIGLGRKHKADSRNFTFQSGYVQIKIEY